MAAYQNPGWTNDQAPAINADNLNAMGQGIEEAQLYGTCTTAASTAAKVATVSFSGTISLYAGLTVRIKFSNGNSAASPSLNVNLTGAKPLRAGGSSQPFTSWSAGQILTFVYDGSNWQYSGVDAYPKSTAARIAYGTYTGNGNYGSGAKNSLTIPFPPKMLLVCAQSSGLRPFPSGDYFDYAFASSFVWTPGLESMEVGFYSAGDHNNVSNVFFNTSTDGSTGTTLIQWYTNGNSPAYQLNATVPYYWVAIG